MKNMLTRKQLSDVHHKKKSFLAEVKKNATNKNSSRARPHISDGAFLTPERLNYVTVFSVKAVLPWKLQLRLEIQVQCRLLNMLYNIVI